jgi:shikimate kinase
MKKNIVLMGFMASGKTTIGRTISRKTGLQFVDTDDEIQSRYGFTISEIFLRMGESYFRSIETKIIENISQSEGVVIACGGGIVKNTANISCLKNKGVLFTLQCDADTIWNRLKCSTNRPLVTGKTKDDIIRLMNDREPLYGCADFFIDTSKGDPDHIAEIIIHDFRTLSK